MCFSAEASFVAGAVLIGGGAAAHVYCRSGRDRLLASIPLLFGIQQVTEGVLWVTLQSGGPKPLQLATANIFCAIASLWPTIFPAALICRRQDRTRRRMNAALLILGIATSTYMLAYLFSAGVAGRIYHYSIRYDGFLPFEDLVGGVYAFVMTFTMFVSRYWWLRTIGILAAVSYAASFLFYRFTYPSVWCFFAAWISFCIVMHLRSLSVKAGARHRLRTLRRAAHG